MRVLKAITRLEITATRVVGSSGEEWHLAPLPPLLQQVLDLAGLPATLYTQLATVNSG